MDGIEPTRRRVAAQLAGRADAQPRRGVLLAACALAALAPRLAAQSEDAAQRIAREVVPQVERAVGLRFRRPPVVAVRDRQQVRRYLDRKIAEQLPPAELAAVQRTYRAFRLVNDTIDLRRLMLDVYSEQVAGFYDPDSAKLFVLRGADPQMVRIIMAHELVHALQDQYMPLNQILKLKHQNDRQMAGQAVAEGQATLASLAALTQGAAELPSLDRMWAGVREGLRQQRESMPVFANAPLIIQEGLLFPYLAGADFMQSFEQRRRRGDEMPYGDRLPVSTEQILHASKYTAREQPRRIVFGPPVRGDTLVYEDDFGEFETRVALQTWGVDGDDAIAAAAGWNGDRYEVFGAPQGTAVVWVTAWDTAEDATQFAQAVRRAWGGTGGPPRGQRWEVQPSTVAGASLVRLTIAPGAWGGWRRPPVVRTFPAVR